MSEHVVSGELGWNAPATTPPLASPRTRAPSAMPRILRALAAPTLLALVVRVALVASLPPSPAWDGVIYERAAEDLGAGRGLTRAIFSRDQPSIPTAFFPVGLPAALAPLRALGAGRTGDLVFQCIVGVALVPLGYALGRRLRGPTAGTVTAWLLALWPGGALLSVSWMTEPLFSLLVGIACTIAAWSSARSRARALAMASAFLALAAYVRPSALVVLAVLALGLAWIDRRRAQPIRRAASYLGVAMLVASSLLTPWALRNEVEIGAPVAVSTNGGFNLLLGTTGDGRYGEMPTELDCPLELGEVAKDRCRADRAVARIADRPAHALARGTLKLVHTFGHESSPSELWAESLEVDDEDRETARLFALAVSEPFWLLLSSGALAGAALLWRRHRGGAAGVAIVACVTGTALVHAIYLGGDRYHAAMVAPMAALAAMALVELRKLQPAR